MRKKEERHLDPRRQLEILGEPYINVRMIYELYPGTLSWARNVMRQIKADLKAEGKNVLSTNEAWVPIKEVLKRYPIDEKRIREYADITSRKDENR